MAIVEITALANRKRYGRKRKVGLKENCGTGAGGFKSGNTCQGGSGASGVDHSGWPGHNSAAKSSIKKISLMEKWASKGDWASIEAVQVKSKKPNKYQKGILAAKENLLKLKTKGSAGAQVGSAASGPTNMNGWKKTGGKLGTEDAGQYTAPDGTKYYVKKPTNAERGKNEVLATKLYSAAGASVVDMNEVAHADGGLGIASKWVDSGKADWNSKALRNKAAEDFAVHAWLGNWDAVGAGSENPMDNIRIKSDGSPILVDAGGALEYKGMGGAGKKPGGLGEDAMEFHSMRDPKINPSAAKVFGGMTDDQIIASTKKLEGMTDQKIATLVDAHGPGTAEDKLKLSKKLIARRDAMLDQADELAMKKKAKPATKDKAPASGKSLIPEDHAIHPDLAAGEMGEEAATAGMYAMWDMAEKGDLAGIQSYDETEIADAIYKDALLGEINQHQKDIGAIPPPAPVKPTKAPKAEPTLPTKPIVTSKSNQSAQKKFDKLHAAALTGDVAAVEAIPTKADAKQTYAKKHHAYKQQLLAAMKNGATASEPLPKSTPAPAKSPKKTTKGKMPLSAIPSSPGFAGTHAAQNSSVATSILNAALTGDMAAVEAIPTGTGSHTKIAKYKAAVLAAMDKKFNPPPPPKPIKEKMADVVAKVKAAKPGAEKVGHFLVVKDFGGVPADATEGDWLTEEDDAYYDFFEGSVADKKWSSLPKTEANSLQSYTGKGYTAQNGSLVKGKPTMAARRSIRAIKKVQEDLPVDVKLSRKFNLQSGQSLKVGQVVSDPKILSTSIDKNVWHGNTHLEITPMQGAKGVKARNFSHNEEEDEVILPPGSKFLIQGVENVGGVTKVKVALLPYVAGQEEAAIKHAAK